MKAVKSAYTVVDARMWGYHLGHDLKRDEMRDGEFDFFRSLAKKSGGPVLELASGAGRVLLTLAEAGFEVYGLEASSEMLRVARKLLKTLPADAQKRVHMIKGDMRRFAFEKPFPLIIIPYCSFWFNFHRELDLQKEYAKASFCERNQAVENQAENCVASMLAALRPRGQFIVDTPRWCGEGQDEWWDRTAKKLGFNWELASPYGINYVSVLIGTKK